MCVGSGYRGDERASELDSAVSAFGDLPIVHGEAGIPSHLGVVVEEPKKRQTTATGLAIARRNPSSLRSDLGGKVCIEEDQTHCRRRPGDRTGDEVVGQPLDELGPVSRRFHDLQNQSVERIVERMNVQRCSLALVSIHRCRVRLDPAEEMPPRDLVNMHPADRRESRDRLTKRRGHRRDRTVGEEVRVQETSGRERLHECRLNGIPKLLEPTRGTQRRPAKIPGRFMPPA